MNTEKIFSENPRWVKVGIVLLVVILSAIAMRETVSLGIRYMRLSGSMENLNGQSSMHEKRYDDNLFDEIDLDRAILEIYGKSAQENDVVVKGLAPTALASTRDFTLLTKEVTLEGDFIELLKCIRDCQNDMDAMKVASIKFEATTVNRRRTLQARVYIQHVQLENHR